MSIEGCKGQSVGAKKLDSVGPWVSSLEIGHILSFLATKERMRKMGQSQLIKFENLNRPKPYNLRYEKEHFIFVEETVAYGSR